jgi:hypothetical protein
MRSIPLPVRALGELFIIVVGVLIALGVDNWNQDRREASREASYLQGILTDLHSDSLELVNRREIAERGMRTADRLMELRRQPGATASADSLAVWFLHAAFVDNFQVLDHTFQEILGAGGLGLIRSDPLRRMLTRYYRSMESSEFFTEYYKNEEIAYFDLLAARLDTDDFEAITRSEEGPGRLNPSRLLAQLRADDEIANAILMNRHWTVLRRAITERRIAANVALADALRAELEDGF